MSVLAHLIFCTSASDHCPIIIPPFQKARIFRALYTSVTSSDKLPVAPLHLSRIMKGKSCNSSTHSSTPPAPSSTHILQPDRKCAVVNAFSTNATTQLSPSPRAPQFLTPPGYSDFTRQDPIQNSLRADKTQDPASKGCNNIPRMDPLSEILVNKSNLTHRILCLKRNQCRTLCEESEPQLRLRLPFSES